MGETQVHVVPVAFACQPLISCEIGHLYLSNLPFLWRSLALPATQAPDIRDGSEVGWTQECEGQAAQRKISAHRGSGLGGDRKEGRLQTVRPGLHSCLCHWARHRIFARSLFPLCGMGIIMLALPTPWSQCKNLS